MTRQVPFPPAKALFGREVGCLAESAPAAPVAAAAVTAIATKTDITRGTATETKIARRTATEEPETVIVTGMYMQWCQRRWLCLTYYMYL